MRKRGTDKGFTLLEVVITVVIVGIGVIPLSYIFTGALEKTQESKTQLVANQLAQQYVESVKAKSYEELKSLDNQTGDSQITFIIDSRTSTETSSFPNIPEAYEASVIVEAQKEYQVVSESVRVALQQDAESKYYFDINGHIYKPSNAGLDVVTITYEEEGTLTDSYVMTLKYGTETIYKQTSKGFINTLQLISHTTQHVNIGNTTSQKVQIEIMSGRESASKITIQPISGSSEEDYEVKQYQAIDYTMDSSEVIIGYKEDKLYKEIDNEGGVPTEELLVNPLENMPHKLIIKNNYDAESKVIVKNYTNQSLDLEIIPGANDSQHVKVEVQKGIINKRYHDRQVDQNTYMLYRLKVEIKNKQSGQRLAYIDTTKKE